MFPLIFLSSPSHRFHCATVVSFVAVSRALRVRLNAHSHEKHVYTIKKKERKKEERKETTKALSYANEKSIGILPPFFLFRHFRGVGCRPLSNDEEEERAARFKGDGR